MDLRQMKINAIVMKFASTIMIAVRIQMIAQPTKPPCLENTRDWKYQAVFVIQFALSIMIAVRIQKTA